MLALFSKIPAATFFIGMLRKNLQDAYYVVMGVVIARKASYHNKKASTPELAQRILAFIVVGASHRMTTPL